MPGIQERLDTYNHVASRVKAQITDVSVAAGQKTSTAQVSQTSTLSLEERITLLNKRMTAV